MVVLAVKTGTHAGACANMPAETLTIGSALTCDVVLWDRGVAAEHLRLERRDGAIHVTALCDDVRLGADALSAGTARMMALPFDVSVAGVHLLAEAHAEDAGTPARRDALLAAEGDAQPLTTAQAARHPRILLAGAVAVAVAATAWEVLAPPSAPHINPTHEGSEVAAAPEIVSDRGTAWKFSDTIGYSLAQADREAKGADPQAATAALSDILRAHGLDGLSAAPEGARAIAVSGVLPPASEAVWHNVQREFDARFAGELLLVKRVERGETRRVDPPAIEAVWSGRDAYVVVDGTKHFVGAQFGEGWRLLSVGETSAVFDYAQSRVTVTY